MFKGLRKFVPWDGHPAGLPTLFFLEAWERFSFYGMKAILFLFLTKTTRGAWGLPEDKAFVYASVYTAMVYLTPLFGGWISDRWLKPRKAVFLGGLMIMAGHFSLALQTVFTFKLGLAFLIMGNGLFKPNVSAMVGKLYPDDDERKSGGYSIFYSGINIGALLGVFICGYLGEKVSWHLGFGAAGVAMLLGLIVVFLRQHTLGTAGLKEGKQSLDGTDMQHILKLAAICIVVGVVCIFALPLLAVVYDPLKAFTGKDTDKVQILFLWRLPLALLLVWLVKVVFKAKDEEEGVDASPGAKFYGIGVLIAAAAFFVCAIGLGQTDGILTGFAETRLDRHLFGWLVPTSWIQNMNPILVVLLAPVFARLWNKWRINDIAKQGIGLLFMAVYFWLVGRAFAHSDDLLHAAGMTAGAVGAPLVSLGWICRPYLLLTLGELCISPIGLALVQKISPGRLVSMMMAIYFLAVYAANTIANPLLSSYKGHEQDFWTMLCRLALGMGIVWIAISVVVHLAQRERTAAAN